MLFPAVIDEMRKRGAGDVIVFGGGTIPRQTSSGSRRRASRGSSRREQPSRPSSSGSGTTYSPGGDSLPPRGGGGEAACSRGSVIRAATSLAPIVLAVVILRRRGWGPGTLFWCIVGLRSVTLVATRAVVGYGTVRRRLGAFVAIVSAMTTSTSRRRATQYPIARSRVARVVEIRRGLGGLRVESLPEERGGVVVEAHVPRGGAGYADVRARLDPLAAHRASWKAGAGAAFRDGSAGGRRDFLRAVSDGGLRGAVETVAAPSSWWDPGCDARRDEAAVGRRLRSTCPTKPLSDCTQLGPPRRPRPARSRVRHRADGGSRKSP